MRASTQVFLVNSSDLQPVATHTQNPNDWQGLKATCAVLNPTVVELYKQALTTRVLLPRRVFCVKYLANITPTPDYPNNYYLFINLYYLE